MTPLNSNDVYELRLRAEQSLMLLGGTPVKVHPEELIWLLDSILDSASNEDLESARREVDDLKEEVSDLQEEVRDLQRQLDAKEAA